MPSCCWELTVVSSKGVVGDTSEDLLSLLRGEEADAVPAEDGDGDAEEEQLPPLGDLAAVSF